MGIQLPYDTYPKESYEPTAVLEALLFLSGQPMPIDEICDHTGWSVEKVNEVAGKLETLLTDSRSGLLLLRVAGGFQIATKPELYDMIQWVRTGTTDLTPMGLEVLAIVAFKQPVTRAEIEKLRGVSSERILSSLIQQGLIIDLGRKDSPGRPILYGTSAYFLECIGMNSLDELADHIPDRPEAAEVESDNELSVEDDGSVEESAAEDLTEEIDGKVTESNE